MKQADRPLDPRTIRRRSFFGRAIKRTNTPGTCLWCGSKLRKKKAELNPEGHVGDYRDNAFCGLRCGYCFGIVAAMHSFRLEPYEGDDD